ncbi:phage antirepressor KilAC domain-containing protein, partial [Bacillus sp. JJ864]|uniref:phage antirepressor KilAC domain-containing protein n=1 Tax=Bacillus sp. JJ864 TaxID=3122975 RepID=UPI002FFD6789
IEGNTSTDVKVVDINEEMRLQIAVGQAFASGDTSALLQATAQMMEFKNRHITKVEQANEKLTLELQEAKPKAQKYEAFLDAEGLATLTLVGKQFLGGMTAVAVRKFLQAEGVLYNRKVDGVYVPKHGFEQYFRITPYTRSSYDIPKVIGHSIKVTNKGIDFIVDLHERIVNHIPS